MSDIIRSFEQFNILNEAKKIEIKDDEIRKIYELLKDFHDNIADGVVYKTRTKLMTLKNATKRIINVLIDDEIGVIGKNGDIFAIKSNRVPTPTKIKALLKEYKKRNRDEDDSKVEFRSGLVHGLLMKIYGKFKRKSFRPIAHDTMLNIVADFNKDNANKVDVEKILYLFTVETPLSRDIEMDRGLKLVYRWTKKDSEPTEALAKKLYRSSYEKETSFEKEMRKEDERILASKLYKMNKEIETASSRIKDLSSKSEESNKKREEEKYRKLLFGK